MTSNDGSPNDELGNDCLFVTRGFSEYGRSLVFATIACVHERQLHQPMSALNRKMLRDLWQMKGQAVAIALVMACGIATFVLSRSMLHSLELTQNTYYRALQFRPGVCFAQTGARVTRRPDGGDSRCRPGADPHRGERESVGPRPRRTCLRQADFPARDASARGSTSSIFVRAAG